jgi:hypothetical protein
VLENRVLRRIFGAKRDEVTGDWRKLHNEKLHNLYSSTNIIRMNKSRRMRWAGHAAQKGENRNTYTSIIIVTKRNVENTRACQTFLISTVEFNERYQNTTVSLATLSNWEPSTQTSATAEPSNYSLQSAIRAKLTSTDRQTSELENKQVPKSLRKNKNTMFMT